MAPVNPDKTCWLASSAPVRTGTPAAQLPPDAVPTISNSVFRSRPMHRQVERLAYADHADREQHVVTRFRRLSGPRPPARKMFLPITSRIGFARANTGEPPHIKVNVPASAPVTPETGASSISYPASSAAACICATLRRRWSRNRSASPFVDTGEHPTRAGEDIADMRAGR